MNKRKWIITLSAVLLVALTAAGYAAISAQYGSQDDPLVSLSYIEDVLKPAVMKQIDDAYAAKKAEFEALCDQKLKDVEAQIDKEFKEYEAGIGSSDVVKDLANQVTELVIRQIGSSGSQTGTSESGWKVVNVPQGKTVVGSVGCQIILRLGSAACVSSGSVGLINLTDGSTLSNGGSLSTNHLYIVTIEGRGFTSTGDTTVLLKGPYTMK